MKKVWLLKLKSSVTSILALAIISGGLVSLVSCKVFRCHKKQDDVNNNVREQPALYGTPPTVYKNNLTD